MSPTIHVQLFPTTFPPANIEAGKRSFHRRRSTRRLEGALLLHLDSKRDLMTNPPTSPRTRAVRRKGQLFNSPTPSISTESDSDYNNADDSPSSSCRVSPLTAGNPVTNGNRALSGRLKAENRDKTTKTGGPQQLAQPFLLQLRSLPVPLTANIKPSISNPPVSKPLSPTSNMLSTTTSSRPSRDLSFDAKQKKLAKLERFLGVNVPPELVFPSSTTTPPSPLQRSTSVVDSGSRASGKVSHKPSLSLPTSIPLSAVPGRVAATPSTPQFQSSREPGTRTQSMSTVPSPTMATPSTRGASLDGSETTVTVELESTPGDERRYRKEGKDWIGEWNVKDMEQVANALRRL